MGPILRATIKRTLIPYLKKIIEHSATFITQMIPSSLRAWDRHPNKYYRLNISLCFVKTTNL